MNEWGLAILQYNSEMELCITVCECFNGIISDNDSFKSNQFTVTSLINIIIR